MIDWKVILIVVSFLLPYLADAQPRTSEQQKTIEKSLRAKYSNVQYHSEGGGWYLLATQRNDGTYYSMADSKGNIIASGAVDFVLYEGYIKLCLADELKRKIYNEWVEAKKKYDIDYQKYCQTNAEYEGVLKSYNLKVEAARQKADVQYKKAVSDAQRLAQEEYKRNANNSGGLFGGVINAIGTAAVTASAAKSVSYDAILTKILEESNLLIPPAKPYNPAPTLPKEPDKGYYWKAFTYQQPCLYSEVDYDAIATPNTYANVKRKGKYGVVNSKLEEVIPCEYDEIRSELGYFLCKQNNCWGVFSNQSKELYPCQYQDVMLAKMGDRLCLFVQSKGLWGAIDFSSGTELLPCRFSNVEKVGGEDKYIKTSANGRVGLYTADGLLLFPCEFTDVQAVQLPEMGNGVYFELFRDRTIGLYDSEGVAIVPIDRYTSYSYQKPFFLVEKDGLFGICTDQAEELLACKYSAISFSSNVFIASLPDDSHGLIDYNGQQLFPFISDSIISVCPNHILLTDNNGKFGALNYRGELIVPIKNNVESVAKKVEQYAKKNDLATENLDTQAKIKTSYEAFAYRYHQILKKKTTFSSFAQNYVERIVNEWQKKGEFEKITDWHKRVNGETRKQKVFMLTKDAQNAYIEKCVQQLPIDELTIIGNYDPDNETYRIRTKYRDEDILVPVNANNALEFKTRFSSLKKEPTFYVEGDTISLAEYKFYLSDNVIFKFNNEASLTYNIARVDYNFDDISIDPTIGSIVSKGKQTISTTNIAIGNSDVDIHIPVTDKKQENTFVVIIANKNYDEAPNVDYAFNDGYMFKEYCIKTLGIPSNNIRFKEDATFNNIRESVNWIRDIATNKVYRGNSKFIFYYSGHGVPDELTRSMYLLPKDGVPMNISTTGYNVNDLYKVLSETSSESLVFLDACFSGFTKSGSALASTKGVVKVTSGAPKGNTVVFSASSSNEVAHQYEEKSHGLFTYYLLKKLQETKGDINLGDLFDYIEKEVVRTSLTVIRKSQTPSVAAGSTASGWAERKL